MNISTAQNSQHFWPQVIFAADNLQEPLQNVHIITTKCAFLVKAQEIALDMLVSTGSKIDSDKVMELTKSVISKGNLWVCESVEVVEDEIFVSIDVDVIDEDTTWTVLDRIYQALTSTLSAPIKQLSYTVDELSTQFQAV
jgi:hypothetical protein